MSIEFVSSLSKIQTTMTERISCAHTSCNKKLIVKGDSIYHVKCSQGHECYYHDKCWEKFMIFTKRSCRNIRGDGRYTFCSVERCKYKVKKQYKIYTNLLQIHSIPIRLIHGEVDNQCKKKISVSKKRARNEESFTKRKSTIDRCVKDKPVSFDEKVSPSSAASPSTKKEPSTASPSTRKEPSAASPSALMESVPEIDQRMESNAIPSWQLFGSKNDPIIQNVPRECIFGPITRPISKD